MAGLLVYETVSLSLTSQRQLIESSHGVVLRVGCLVKEDDISPVYTTPSSLTMISIIRRSHAATGSINDPKLKSAA
jgi:hypothetical protein